MMIALRPDHDVYNRRAADDLLALGLRDAARDRNPHLAAVACRLILGDARLSLVNVPPASYDILVVDAFTSDAIPTHLITREALELYLGKLAPGGVGALHISNRYLDLEPVVAGIPQSVGASALVGSDTYLSPAERGPFRSLSKWVAISRSPAAIAPLRSLRGWREPEPSRGAPWTDDFTNVLGVFRWR